MWKIIKLELDKLKIPYMISFGLAIIYGVAMIILSLSGYHYNYNIEVWDESGEIFSFFFPLFAVIPTCWLMYFERKNHFIFYTIARVSTMKYLFTKWLVSSAGGALVIFSVSFVSLIICLYFIPDIEPAQNDYAIRNFAGYYFVNHPFIYGLVLSVWKAVLGYLMASFGFVISLYYRNLFVVLTGPFVYYVLENFILSVLGVPYYRLVTSFDPSTLTPEVVTFPRMLVGPALVIFFETLLIGYFSVLKKVSIHQA